MDKDGKVHFGDSPPSNTPVDRIPTQAPRAVPAEDVRTNENNVRKLEDYLKQLEQERQGKQAKRQALEAAAARERAVRLERCLVAQRQLKQLKPLNPDLFYERDDGLDPWIFGGVAKGTREYALDPNRTAKIERLRKDVNTYCDTNKEGIAKQEKAIQNDIERGECASAGLRLAELKRPQARADPAELRAMEDWIAAHCKPNTR